MLNISQSQLNQCQPFEPHEPHVMLLSTLALLFYTLDKNPRWVPDCWFEGVRLVVNQSVVPVEVESSPEDQSCLSAVYTLRLYSLY